MMLQLQIVKNWVELATAHTLVTKPVQELVSPVETGQTEV
jgi:hypothetical protein